ncbi:hypothetical protein [Micromonospora peucetia]|uniref:Beta-lactamase enzyme family protein n=1 Tax=Micromonospora peucetia TaxID=47871 RepID=A0A1C6UR19_9ACTN|nr:hypothetical protein [Micromonospora peucetia]WSA34636.1 hypothetical protein OIE14_11605 [Micromonospora peucetia]SCL56259.1 hypothetical protein GA0070608_1624 [Micromonospora peucetia]
MRSRVTLVLAVVAVLLGGGLLVPAAYARLAGDDAASGGSGGGSVAAPAPIPPLPPTLAAGPVSVDFKGEFFSWALMDRETGEISGSKNLASTSSTESMIKAWFAADYLREREGISVERKNQIITAIRDSNDDAANALYNAVGRAATIKRMVSTCELTDTKPGNVPGYVGWWSFTRMSPRDAVRLGDCIADGTAAGPKWTKILLNEMSKVRGSTADKDQKARSGGGRWGIIDGLPQSILSQGPVHMKNGWTPLSYDGNWHVNCLAVTDKWSLAVMLRYPQKSGLDYGAQTCASVASQLVTPQPGAALKVPQQPTGKL